MKNMKLIIAAAMMAAAATQTPVLGLTLTQSATAPTVYTETQDGTGGNNSDRYTSTETTGTGFGANGVGDTFQVFSPTETGTGYDDAAELLSVTVEDNSASAFASHTYTLTIYSVAGASGSYAGGTATAIDTETVSTALTANKQYLTFTLANYVQLSPSTVYLFTLSTGGSAGITLANTVTGLTYSGGLSDTTARVANVDSSDNVIDTGTGSGTPGSGTGSATGSLVFFLDTVPVPEPADWALVPVIGTIAFFGLRRLRFSSAS